MRPRPVCTSSRISSASRSSHSAADGLEVAGGRRLHAALALHRLEQHRADPLVERGGERVDVGEGDLAEAGRQRLERLLLLRLAGRGERGERAAVERAVGGEHVEALGSAVRLPVTAGELDRALVGLGARVGEEDPAAAAEQVVEARAESGLHVVVVEVRHVEQGARLFRDGVGDHRVRVAERDDREAGEEVEVTPAVGVEEQCALAPHERDGEPARRSP